MRKLTTAFALALLLATTTACAAGDSTDSVDAGPGVEGPSDSGAGADAGTAAGAFTFATVKSCDQVAALVSPYIQGLVPAQSNEVNEWGVFCDWEMADDETDVANNRGVSVALSLVEEGAPKPDSDVIVQTGGELIDDAWVRNGGGLAYSASLTMSDVAGGSLTTVWMPGVESSVSGWRWGAESDLDSAAALEIVKSLVTESR